MLGILYFKSCFFIFEPIYIPLNLYPTIYIPLNLTRRKFKRPGFHLKKQSRYTLWYEALFEMPDDKNHLLYNPLLTLDCLTREPLVTVIVQKDSIVFLCVSIRNNTMVPVTSYLNSNSTGAEWTFWLYLPVWEIRKKQFLGISNSQTITAVGGNWPVKKSSNKEEPQRKHVGTSLCERRQKIRKVPPIDKN